MNEIWELSFYTSRHVSGMMSSTDDRRVVRTSSEMQRDCNSRDGRGILSVFQAFTLFDDPLKYKISYIFLDVALEG